MSLEQTIQFYRQKLLAQEAQSEHVIRSAHTRMLSVVTPHLNALLKQYKDAQATGSPVPLHWLYTANKLPAIKMMVAKNVNQFGSTTKAQVIQGQHTGVQLGQQSAQAQLATSAPAQKVKPAPDARAQKIVGTTQQGKPIASVVDGLGDEASDRVGKALIAGISIGQQPDTISRAIMAALLISLSRAITIDQASMMYAYRSALLLTFQVNNDIAQQWEWIAEPDACKRICLPMNGTRHDMSEEMESHPFCRCSMKVLAIGA